MSIFSQTLRDELREYQWSIAEFAKQLGYSLKDTENLLDTNSLWDDEKAKDLARVFDTTDHFWLNLVKWSKKAGN